MESSLMETSHHNEQQTKALAEREELFRYADLKHPLIALLFTEATLEKLTPDESDQTWL
ncbi:hypothetical protein [Methylophaga pinxianii]|uniref:hypothetical protein n=1 Tax=Methylophaga pinxianii TaxID=2881052 RepID=UPI001CF5CEF0|nr:hypothetical protein [Methylophaga pinxianii]UPH46664.1 hypothetical protein LGT42_005100 [Methylophaga pinxianii]